jgi:hypothetical protein
MNKFFRKKEKWFTEVKCPDCSLLHDVSHKNYYAQKKGIRNLSFRCRSCGLIRSHKSRRDPNRKKILDSGYVKLYRPENPMADKRGEVYEHRLVMSQMLDRHLGKKEHVHHKDGNKTNNSRKNLELWSQTAHLSMHTKKRIEMGDIILTNHGIQKRPHPRRHCPPLPLF